MNIISPENRGGLPSPRRSLLDLAPLELDCMTTLWPMGEGTVREIRDQLAPRLPRAYTTIMTIMDRLARKGVVERRKVGRAYRYRPNLVRRGSTRARPGASSGEFFWRIEGSRDRTAWTGHRFGPLGNGGSSSRGASRDARGGARSQHACRSRSASDNGHTFGSAAQPGKTAGLY